MCKQLRIFILLLLIALNKASGQDSAIIAIEGVNVIPLTEELVLPKQRVLIANGKIIKIEPASSIDQR